LAQAPALPAWAYPVASGPGPAAPPKDEVMHVPGSTAAYTRGHIADLMEVPDWFPDSHPAMPQAVAHGRNPDVYACAYCHLPNGAGRPENQSVAGLPVAYMMEQLRDFRLGLRHSSEPRMGSVSHMIAVAKGATPQEMAEGVAYFASLKPQKWIRVVEQDTVPKTRIAGGMLVLSEAGGTEAIGDRVIEVPENLEQTELRNSRSGFVAYVPVGSLKEGEALVRTGGNGKTMACTMCHGQDLRGVGDVPSIAGRSPSQMARQIIDIKDGSRNGAGAMMMKGPVAGLSSHDIVVITGYLASLAP
jgi:cytochrome c553